MCRFKITRYKIKIHSSARNANTTRSLPFLNNNNNNCSFLQNSCARAWCDAPSNHVRALGEHTTWRKVELNIMLLIAFRL